MITVSTKNKKYRLPKTHGKYTVRVVEPNVNYLKIQNWIDESVGRIFASDELVQEIKNKVKIRIWED